MKKKKNKVLLKLAEALRQNSDYCMWLKNVEAAEANKKEFLKTQERSFNEVL